jgi:hypothetical protein
MKKIVFVLLIALIVSSCTITARPVEHRREPEHRHRGHMCTEKYYDRNHHCRHDHGKHKGHHKH